MSYVDFSSWPRDQEQSFVVYEQRANESSRTAFTIGISAAVVAFIAMVGIYAGVEPDHKDISKDMNMSNLTKKQTKKDPTPTPDKAEAPKAEAPKAEVTPPAAKP